MNLDNSVLKADPPAASANDAMFFVVSIRKLIVMNIFTFGLYWTYWYYQNWSRYRRKSGERVLPLVRTLFGILFLYGLLSRVDRQLRMAGHHHAWSPFWLTCGFILLAGATAWGSWLREMMPTLDLGVVLINVAGLWLLAWMQRAINLCAGDPEGQSNSRLSVWNWVWMVPGILLWIAISLGIALWLAVLFGLSL